MLAVIGGSGLAQLASLEVGRRQIVRTPYGEPSGPLTFGRLAGTEVVFLARHGYGHTLAPHEINYRANLWALREKGATRILAVCTVGGISPEFGAGALAVPGQIIDYTWGRKATFYEGAGQPVTHVDFTHPYCEATRRLIVAAAEAAGVAVVPRGTYAAVQGPRLEPEAGLARELGIPYAALAVVANAAAGRGASAEAVSLEAISHVLREAMGRVRRILAKVAESHGRP
jgi:5'-methylthioadenosine phosphorylase